MKKKTFSVSLQASCTVRFTRSVSALDEAQAKDKLLVLFVAINSGMVGQCSEFGPPFSDASLEITEAPQIEHDFVFDDIEVEKEEEEGA